MRISLALRSCALLLIVAASTLLKAQFMSLQPINPDELKMTSDPKAPGADAVYLEIRQITNDDQEYDSYYARIKILTEKGKDLATIQVPYIREAEKITDVKGRTIHADGTEIPLEVKPEDLLIVKSGDLQVNRKVFTMPSVEVGSVLEFTWTMRFAANSVYPPDWDVQLPYFVHKAHYEFLPYKSFRPGSDTISYVEDQDGDKLSELISKYTLPPGVEMQRGGATALYTLDVTDVPAQPDEDWMPPVESYLYKVRFYYKDALDPQHWWLQATQRWNKRVNRFVESTRPIQAAVAQIVSPSDSDVVKAQKLYAAVQALDNTDFTRVRTASEREELHLRAQKRAEDTWQQKSGSGNDIALLYLAMLRAAGLTAYPVQVADRSERAFDINYLSLDQFSDVLVIFKNGGGEETFLDPGEKMCPFGQLAWNHTSTNGLRQEDKGFSITGTPASAYGQNSVIRSGDLALDAHGGVSGRVQIVMAGQPALTWRQRSLKIDEAELKKQFDHELASEVPDGVEAHVDHFLGLSDPDSKFIAVVNVTGTMGIATSKRIIAPAYFFESRATVPFLKEEKREMPVDMHYADVVTDQIAYHLPQGVTVEGAPPTADVAWAGHAHYIAKSTAGPGQITITRSFARAFTFAKPEEYQDLRGLYQKIGAADQGQLVLTAASTTTAAAGQGN